MQMRGAEIGGAAGDLGQVRMAAVTMFNTPYHERMILQEKQEAMQRVREAKLKQKEELRRQKFAHIGQENRQKKHVDAKKGRIVQDKKIKQQQRDAEEIAKHRQEAELKKKMNEEKNKQREMRVAQREERQAREELRRIAKLREDDKKQIQAQKQALERAAREKQVKQLRERDARARHKRNHDTAEAKREVVYDERDIRVREKHYNQLQKIANDRQVNSNYKYIINSFD